jgi:hypothetical protein
MSPSGVLSGPSPCNVPQGYASVAELPAALLGYHFEHPARCPPVVLHVWTIEILACQNSFSQPVGSRRKNIYRDWLSLCTLNSMALVRRASGIWGTLF